MPHFLTVVNERNTDVGCAMVKYGRDDMYHVIFTCNYAANNHLSRRVYETGSACSKCLTGCHHIYNALCSPEEKINPNSHMQS